MTELEKCELAKIKGFTYCPLSGNLRGTKGGVITSKDADGYIICSVYIDKKPYVIKSHRLAWFLYYGEIPNNQIDHKDGVRTNNKIENLRDVTSQQNHFNNTKAKGYRWDKRRQKFQSHIKLNGKFIHVGMFNTEPEARAAYLEAKKKYHII